MADIRQIQALEEKILDVCAGADRDVCINALTGAIAEVIHENKATVGQDMENVEQIMELLLKLLKYLRDKGAESE